MAWRRWLLCVVVAVSLCVGTVTLAGAATLPVLPPVSPPTIAWDVMVAVGAGVSYFLFHDEVNEAFEVVGTWLQNVTRWPNSGFTVEDVAEAVPEYPALAEPGEPGGGEVLSPGAQAVARWLVSVGFEEAEGAWVRTASGPVFAYVNGAPSVHTAGEDYRSTLPFTFDFGVASFVGAPSTTSHFDAILAMRFRSNVCWDLNPDSADEEHLVAATPYWNWCDLLWDAPVDWTWVDWGWMTGPLSTAARLRLRGVAANGDPDNPAHIGLTSRVGADWQVVDLPVEGGRTGYALWTQAYSEYYVVPFSVSAEQQVCGMGAAYLSGAELVRVTTTMGTPTRVLDTAYWTETVTVSTVATVSFAEVVTEWTDPSTGMVTAGSWTSGWFGVQPLAAHLMWHAALWHWVRSRNTCGATYADVDFIWAGGGDLTLPWDEVGAPDWGWATQAETGHDVLWIVRPVEALREAFVPTVSVAARVEDLLTVLRGKFPFALAQAISFSGVVGAGPLAVQAVEFGGLRIEADNSWLNQLGGVTRVAATVLLVTLLFVWLRGKVTPRTVI